MNPVEFKIYELFHEVIYGGKYNLLAEEFRNRSKPPLGGGWQVISRDWGREPENYR